MTNERGMSVHIDHINKQYKSNNEFVKSILKGRIFARTFKNP